MKKWLALLRCFLLVLFLSCGKKTDHQPNLHGQSATDKLYEECIRFSFNPRFTCVEADSSSIELFTITAQDPAYQSYRGDVFGEILWGNVKLCMDDMVITCDSARWIPADSVLAIDGTVVLESPKGTLKGSGLVMHISESPRYTIHRVIFAYELEEPGPGN
jgi:hypothetical protein